MGVGEVGPSTVYKTKLYITCHLSGLQSCLILVLKGELSICSRYNDVLYGGCSLCRNHCSTANPGSAPQPTSTESLNVEALLILHFVLLLFCSSRK